MDKKPTATNSTAVLAALRGVEGMSDEMALEVQALFANTDTPTLQHNSERTTSADSAAGSVNESKAIGTAPPPLNPEFSAGKPDTVVLANTGKGPAPVAADQADHTQLTESDAGAANKLTTGQVVLSAIHSGTFYLPTVPTHTPIVGLSTSPATTEGAASITKQQPAKHNLESVALTG